MSHLQGAVDLDLQPNFVFARDPLGTQPFYYAIAGRRFIYGSEIRHVLADTCVSRRHNEGMIGEFLSGNIASRAETLYQSVRRLPPGHSLTITPRGIAIRNEWQPDLESTLRFRDPNDYSEALLEVLNGAIRDRLPKGSPAAAELSGGIDSSTITALAAEQLDGNLATYSLAYPGEPCDESQWFRAVARHCNVPNFEVTPGVQTNDANSAQCAQYLDLPDYPNGAVSEPLRRLAASHGARTLFTGLGGDECFAGSALHYSDNIRTGTLACLTRNLAEDSRAAGGIAPLLPWLKQGLRPLFPARAVKVPEWIDPVFARRINLADRLNAREAIPPCRSFARREMFRVLTSGWAAHLMEMNHRGAARDGIEYQHPFLDRRVVEFALSLPEDQKLHALRTKRIVRTAMRGKLPQVVLDRTSKAEFSSTFQRRLEHFRISSSIAPCLNMAHVQRLGDDHLWPRWHTLALSLWSDATLTRAAASY